MREARAACQESEASGVPIDEVIDIRAERRFGRRAFLKGSGVVAGGLLLQACTTAGPRPAPGREPATAARIVIVGAGAAGIRCAHSLYTDHGMHATVFEASDRVGGRIYTGRGYFLNDQIAEMHGENVDSSHAAILSLCKRFDLGLDVTNYPRGSEDLFWIGGSRYSQAQLTADWNDFGYRRFNQAVRKLGGQRYDDHNQTDWDWDHISSQEWVESHLPGGSATPFGKLCLAALKDGYAEDPSVLTGIDVVWNLGYNDSLSNSYQRKRYPALDGADESYHITGGNDQLITEMVAELPVDTVQTEQALVALRANGNGTYTCTFSSGASTHDVVAEHVVLALPPGSAIQAVDLTKAGLSDLKMRCIDGVGNGSAIKTFFQMDGRPWLDHGYNGDAFTDDPIVCEPFEANYQTNNYDSHTSIYEWWAAGSDCRNLIARYGLTAHEAVPPTQMVQDILRGIDSKLYPGTRAAFNGRAWYHTGQNNPWDRGAYSYWPVGGITGFYGYESVAEGNVHFAGEWTSYNFNGWMEGAIRSGERAAAEISRN